MTRRDDIEMQERIKTLIEQEPDARERIRLLILLQISSIQTDNIGVVQGLLERFEDHTERFSKHVADEQKLINQGRGAWKVIGVGLVLLQAALGWIYIEQVDAIKHMQVAIASNAKEIAVINDRLKRGPAP